MPRKARNPIIRLLADSRRQWGWLALCVLLLALAGVLQTGVSWLFGRMTDEGIAGQSGALLRLARPMAALLLLDALRNVCTYSAVAATTERMFLALRLRVFQALARMRVDVLERQLRSGDIVMRVNGDLSQLCEQVAGQYTWFTRVTIRAAVALAACLWMSWQLSLAYFLLLPPALWLLKRQSAPIRACQKRSSEQVGCAMNVASDLLHGLMASKSFGLYWEMDRRFRQASQQSVEASIEMEKTGVKMNAVKYVSTLLPLCAMLAVGVFLVSAGITTAGTVIAFAGVSAYVREAVDLSDLIVSSLRQSASLCTRIYEVLDCPAEEPGESFAPAPDEPVCRMRGITFRYPGGPPVCRDISLQIRRGEHIGVVGSSGSGKSTLLKLFCRFYLPDGGLCELFGHDVTRWSPAALRQHISLITQDPFLFDGTILENVRDGCPAATEQQVEQALRGANLWDFVQSLPQQGNTRVGEDGARLSGGQKQRVAIARALLKNAQLVLLDEATSALDVESEKEVQEALDRLLQGRTAVVVAHRLTTLRHADRILVLEGGQIVEEGPRQELLDRRGRFYELYQRQMSREAEA